MKTADIIIAAVLSLQAGVIFNGMEGSRPVSDDATSAITISYVPVTPAVATFEDAADANDATFDLSSLAPSVPSVADFNEVVPEVNFDLKSLAPVAPAEADFSDTIATVMTDLSRLAPVTPAEADFE